MLFHVKMTVNLPVDMNPERAARLKADEKALARRLQEQGKWRHLWRIAGLYANYSVFDVDSVQELHDLLMQLPLYPYMAIEVNALCRHPSSIHEDDRLACYTPNNYKMRIAPCPSDCPRLPTPNSFSKKPAATAAKAATRAPRR